MKRISKVKYLIGILMFLITLSISNVSFGWYFKTDGHGYVATTQIDGDWVFCIHMGGTLRNSDDLVSNVIQSQGYFCNYGSKCNNCSGKGPTSAPVLTTDGKSEATTTEMTSETPVDWRKHQDVAYALAFGVDQERIQTAIWQTELNSGPKDLETIIQEHITSGYTPDNGLANEAKAYKRFYEEKEKAGGFEVADNTDYENIKIIADQKEDTYIIGKYNIDYVKGLYQSNDRVVKFGYIDEIIVKDQNGKNVEIVDIIDTKGESIMSRSGYRYPNSGEDFYIKIKANPEDKITKVSMNAKFKYIDRIEANMNAWEGWVIEWSYGKDTGEHSHNSKDHTYSDTCTRSDSDGCGSSSKPHTAYKFTLQKIFKKAQKVLRVSLMHDAGRSGYAIPYYGEAQLYKDNDEIEIDLTMDLGGRVFLDVPGEKDTSLTNVDGKFNPENGDVLLPNIEVTLYQIDENGEITLVVFDDDEKLREEYGLRINPMLTNENGEYMFRGLNSQYKYFVTYKINGQYLESSMYTAKVEEYNSDNWKVSNMGYLLDADRAAYNKIFETIESAPNNYKVINKIFESIREYNKTYNIFDQTSEVGQKEADEIKKLEADIIAKIRKYIEENLKYPDDLAMRAIYGQVASENSEIQEVENKIQYLVDIQVITKTASLENHHEEIQAYPIYDVFVIDREEYVIGETKYPPIYEGQLNINLGVIEREKADLKLSKDITSIKVTINGKEYVYKCDRRQNEPVEVELRGTDIELSGNKVNYYERKLRESDIKFIDYIKDESKKLRVYVTYRIRVTNQSNSALTMYVNGLNDYYDPDYTYLSSRVVRYNTEGIESDNQLTWENDKEKHKLSTKDPNLTSIPLKVSEYLDVYNDFEITTDGLKKLLTEKEATKENYAEIESYKTYYTEDRIFPDGDVITVAGAVAGLVDRDSRPGDFDLTNGAKRFEVETFTEYSYSNEFYNKTSEERTIESLNVFQDDADKAPGLKLILDTVLREINGNVWEDSVISDLIMSDNIRRGDGIKKDNEKLIKGMKVELIDVYETESVEEEPYKVTKYNKVADIYDSENFKEAITYTGEDGAYQFKGYVPGDYLIRYTYGEDETLMIDSNGKVYNGQDYKSTLYNEEKHQVEEGDATNYWYTAENDNESDAHDNYDWRNIINDKNKEMTNSVATILDYKASINDQIDNDKLNKLNDLEARTIMFAETNKLVLEVEYAKTESEYDAEFLKDYIINNIDFGIVERPRSELTLIKDVENIRIIGNNGSVIFDANEQKPNMGWIKPHVDEQYNGEYGRINPIVDSNLLHGATIKILYKFTIKNTGEVDYINADGSGIDEKFYNTGEPSGRIVTTKADYVIDYVENNMEFNVDEDLDVIDTGYKYNQYWEKVDKEKLIEEGLTSLDANTINSYKTIIKATGNEPNISPLLKELLPATAQKEAESAETTLLLTKVLNEDNDNLVYNNSAEIIKTENEAGRRSYNNLDKTKNDISEAVISIPGNYNPNEKPKEPDENRAEEVVVQPAFGEENRNPYIIVIAIAGIVLAGGILIIKKFIIDKR